jgi:hypothetical protein
MVKMYKISSGVNIIFLKSFYISLFTLHEDKRRRYEKGRGNN